MENKDTIKALSTREQCRDKVAVFYGSADNYLHGLREVITNSIDEINNNFDKGLVKIKLYDDKETVEVIDTGRGIPLDGKSVNVDGEMIENYKLLFETLFAGSNYDNDKNGKETGGVNGVGTCVLNHTSDVFEVDSFRNGNIYSIAYKDGGDFIYFKETGKTNNHGTKIKFKLSKEVYTNTIYNPEELKDICKHFAACNNKVKIVFEYKDEVFEYKYDSLKDYFDKEATKSQTDKFMIDNHIIQENGERNRVSFIITCAEKDTFQETYLNGIYLPLGGTIYDGIVKGFRLCMNRYIKDKNMYENNEKQINDKDVEGTINFIASVRSTKQSYEGQTKFATKKKLYEEQIKKLIEDKLQYFIAENPYEIEKMANAILINKRANEKAILTIDKARNKLKQIMKATPVNKMAKFTNCRKKKGGMCFIAEGNSAATALKYARDGESQAIYALRGKMQNILKKNKLKSIENEEIKDLITIFNCGVEIEIDGYNLFDMDSFRFDEGIAIATDADPDGGHIFCLAVTFIYILFPTLIKEGKVFKFLTPLFEIRDTVTDEMYYAYTDTEKEEIIKGLKKYHISRCKGLM